MGRVFVFNSKDNICDIESIVNEKEIKAVSEDIISGEALVDKLQALSVNGLIKAEMDKYRASHPHLDYLSAKEWALSPEGKEYIGNVLAMHHEKLRSKFDPYADYRLSIIDDNNLSMNELSTLLHNCIHTFEVK